MKKRSLVKKALLPAIVAVLCSVIALTSVSYAWFTLGNTASVSDIDVNVTAAEGLQISADGTNWKSIMKLSDFDFESNQLLGKGAEVSPVSSAGNVVGGKLQLFNGVFEQDKLTTTVAKELDANDVDNFIAFDIYIKLDAVTDFCLAAESVVSAESKNTHSAVRVAFVNLGTNVTKDEVDKSTSSVGTAAEPVKALIWEPNSKLSADGVSRTDKVAYKGVKAAGEKFAITADAEQLENVETFDLDGTNDYVLYEDLAAGITKVRVYIWLEGQDVDCINDISGSDGSMFSVELQFAIPENEAEGE